MRTKIAAIAAASAVLTAWLTVATAQPASDALRRAVDNPARSTADRERDARDKPAELMAFAGVTPGMTIADVFGGGGYWAELFSYAVGPSGRVLLVNNMPYRDASGAELETRLGNGRLGNVEHRLVEASYMRLPERSLDLAVIVMSYHDLYYIDERGWPAIDVERFFASVHGALKPGGRFLIVDHAAPAGSGNTPAQNLHRIDPQFAIADFANRGFVLEKSWDGLRNPMDDLSKNVFDAAVRGKTDRFVHLYRKR
jgi:predicted methyltransferase